MQLTTVIGAAGRPGARTRSQPSIPTTLQATTPITARWRIWRCTVSASDRTTSRRLRSDTASKLDRDTAPEGVRQHRRHGETTSVAVSRMPHSFAFFERRSMRQGWEPTLTKYLPLLISGWVKDAFHPLIRLGYGIEFESTSEIAAGLAYMTITGNDPALANMAMRGASQDRGRSYIESIASRCDDPRYFVGDRSMSATNGSPKARNSSSRRAGRRRRSKTQSCVSRESSTQHTISLRCIWSRAVTRSACARRGPAPGPTSLFSIGLATAYLAIGAPSSSRWSRNRSFLADRSARQSDRRTRHQTRVLRLGAVAAHSKIRRTTGLPPTT